MAPNALVWPLSESVELKGLNKSFMRINLLICKDYLSSTPLLYSFLVCCHPRSTINRPREAATVNNLTHFHIHHHISVINFLIYFDTRCKSVTLFYFDISLRTYAASSPVSASIRHSFALPFRAKKTHVVFVSKETRRVMTSQIQAIANYNNVQKTCQLSDGRLATALPGHQPSAC